MSNKFKSISVCCCNQGAEFQKSHPNWLARHTVATTKEVFEGRAVNVCWPHFNLFKRYSKGSTSSSTRLDSTKYFDRRLQVSRNIFGLECCWNHFGARKKNELLLIVVESEVKQISRVFFTLHTLNFPFVVCQHFWQLRIAFSTGNFWVCLNFTAWRQGSVEGIRLLADLLFLFNPWAHASCAFELFPEETY